MKTYSDYGIELGGRTGIEIQAICPQCSGSRRKKNVKCLSVNTDKGLWCCHHCGWIGSLKYGTENKPDKRKNYIKPQYPVKYTLPAELVPWFQNRKISTAILEKYKISIQSAYIPAVEDFQTCITFPYFRNGEIVNIKYRSKNKNFRQIAGAEKILYGIDDIENNSWAIIVEGEVDKLSFAEAGIYNVVSVPDGAPPPNSRSTDIKFEYLENCKTQLDKLEKVIIAVDNDAAGKMLEQELKRRLGVERCWRVEWSENCKDANDVLVKFGVIELQEIISFAKPYPLEGVIEPDEIIFDVLALYQKGVSGGISTGWISLDRYYTVRPGELTVVTGIPSHGKSQFLDALMINLAKQEGWRFGVCSPENLPVERHIAKLIELYSGFPFHAGYNIRLPAEDLDHCMKWINEHFVFIAPEETMGIEDVVSNAKRIVKRYGINGLVVDPWNEFDHTRANGVTETENVSIALGKLRRFGRNNKVKVWLVAHPQKLYRQADGTYPVPTPYDISGCYSSDTEVLTNRGWLLHQNIKEEDTICCFDTQTELLSYLSFTKKWEYDYEGEMINLKSPSFDLLITPNHRVVVKPDWRNKQSFKNKAKFNGIGRPPTHPISGWSFVEAQNLKSDLRMPFGTKLMDCPEYPIIDNDLRIIGWWITEGWESQGSIAFCQATGSLADKMLETVNSSSYALSVKINKSKIVNELPIQVIRFKNRYCERTKKFTKMILSECGVGCENKKLPLFTWQLSFRQKNILFQALMEGDGSMSRGDSFRFATTSRQLVDDIQRLSIELGRMTCFSQQIGACEHHKTRYQINIGQTRRKSITLNMRRHKNSIIYNGKVYCLTVPTGAYITRRNGKGSICGNSAHFRNKADNCLTIWRNEQEGDREVKIYVQKIRFKEIGRTGDVSLQFNPVNGRYADRMGVAT